MIKKVPVPTDGSDHATKAVEFASDMGVKYKAKLVLLHVVDHKAEVPEGVLEFIREEHIQERPAYVYLQMLGRKIMEAAEGIAKKKGAKEVESIIVEGNPAERIIDFAKDNRTDLIVMGSRGLGAFGGLFLGSVSHKVNHLAPCTCVTVK